mgnify:CR=1 FL=1
MPNKNLPIVDWRKIESSAPGKIIISGEYSVVYGKQAIASAIDLRTRVTIRPNKDGKVRLHLRSLNISREWPTASLTLCRLVSRYSECLYYDDNMPVKLNQLLHTRYIQSTPRNESDDANSKDRDKKANDAAMAFLLLYIGLGDSFSSSGRPPIDVEVGSDVPIGSGLGSSSAYSVALCGALMRVFRVSAEKYIVSDWAFNIDKLFHGRPSGVDNNIITTGGYILFQNGKIKATGCYHKNPIRVMLVDTGVSRSTRALSEVVVNELRDDPSKVNSTFNNINELTTQIWRKINDPNFIPKNIAIYLQANQELLDTLGVGHEKLSDICLRAQSFELTAKQTGAGGGGTAFVLYDETDRQRASQLGVELKEAGYHIHDHLMGCEGLVVRIEADTDRRFGV